MTDSTPNTPHLPAVDDAVLAEMSGLFALGQDELWSMVGQAQTGALGAWALREANRLRTENTGVEPYDAFLAGLGYAVTALARQLKRNENQTLVKALFALYNTEAGPKDAQDTQEYSEA